MDFLQQAIDLVILSAKNSGGHLVP